MNPIEELNLKQVRLFKSVLHGVVEGFEKSGVEFQLLAIATAAEEFAQELRQQSADEAKPKNYPDWIG